MPTLVKSSVWVCFLKIYQEENSETVLGFSLFSLEMGSEMEFNSSPPNEADFLPKATQTDLLSGSLEQSNSQTSSPTRSLPLKEAQSIKDMKLLKITSSTLKWEITFPIPGCLCLPPCISKRI